MIVWVAPSSDLLLQQLHWCYYTRKNEEKRLLITKLHLKKRISMLCSHQNTEEIPTPTQLLLPQWQVWTPIPKSKAFNPDFCVANVDLKPIMTDNQKLFLLELPPNQKFQKYPKMKKIFSATSLILISIVFNERKILPFNFHGFRELSWILTSSSTNCNNCVFKISTFSTW